MPLTFEEQLADVPQQLGNYPQPLLDDRTLLGMLCNAGRKINTTDIETAYILQTPLKDYITFTFDKVWRAAYLHQNNSAWHIVTAPNSSFLIERGAIPVADLGPMLLYEYEPMQAHTKDRLFFSSAAQIAVQSIQEIYGSRGYFPTRFLSRNVSNLTCQSAPPPFTLPATTTQPLFTVPATTPPPLASLEQNSNTALYVSVSVLAFILLLGSMLYYFMHRSKKIGSETTAQFIAYRQIPHSQL